MKKFLSNEKGGMAIMAGFSVPVVALATFFSLEYTRAVAAELELQDILDQTVISCARNYDSESQDNFSWRECSNVNFQRLVAEEVQNLTISSLEWNPVDDTHVEANVVADFDSPLMNAFGLDDFEIGSYSRALIDKPAKLDVALVLDISFSMRGAPFDAMRAGAQDFVTTLFDAAPEDAEIFASVIPFGGNVRFPSGYDDWLRPEFVDWDGEGVNPFLQERENTESCEDSHINESLNVRCRADQTWTGCFVPGTDAEISSRLVDRVSLRDPALNFLADFSQGITQFCPTQPGEALFHSSDRDAVLAKVTGLRQDFSDDENDPSHLSVGTGTDIAMGIAVQSVNPDNQGSFVEEADAPHSYGPQTKKHIVFLTDGSPWGAYRRNEGRPQTGATNTATICSEVAENNDGDESIHIWTIAYNFGGGSFSALVQSCATGAGGFYIAGTDDISAILAQIATDITSVHAFITG